MARRPNYGAEKRGRQLDKAAKRQEKEEKKRARREANAAAGITEDGELDVASLADGDADDDDGEDEIGGGDDE
jgi:hypothetical protein